MKQSTMGEEGRGMWGGGRDFFLWCRFLGGMRGGRDEGAWRKKKKKTGTSFAG